MMLLAVVWRVVVAVQLGRVRFFLCSSFYFLTKAQRRSLLLDL